MTQFFANFVNSTEYRMHFEIMRSTYEMLNVFLIYFRICWTSVIFRTQTIASNDNNWQLTCFLSQENPQRVATHRSIPRISLKTAVWRTVTSVIIRSMQRWRGHPTVISTETIHPWGEWFTHTSCPHQLLQLASTTQQRTNAESHSPNQETTFSLNSLQKMHLRFPHTAIHRVSLRQKEQSIYM